MFRKVFQEQIRNRNKCRGAGFPGWKLLLFLKNFFGSKFEIEISEEVHGYGQPLLLFSKIYSRTDRKGNKCRGVVNASWKLLLQ